MPEPTVCIQVIPREKIAIIHGRYDYAAGNNVTITAINGKVLVEMFKRYGSREYHAVEVLPGAHFLVASAKFPNLFSSGYRYFS